MPGEPAGFHFLAILQPAVLAVAPRLEIGPGNDVQFVGLAERLGIDWATAAEVEHVFGMDLIGDRNVPQQCVAVLAGRTGDDGCVGHHEVGDPQIGALVELAHGVDPQPEARALDLEPWRAARIKIVVRVGGAGCIARLSACQRAMEKVQVKGINVPFQPLQVIAALAELPHGEMIGACAQTFELRQDRRLAFAHVGKDHPARAFDRIGGVLDALTECLSARLGRLLEALAGHIEDPTVIKATQPAAFDATEAEIGAAVRTMQAKKA